jgi:hypothetical protein
MAGSCVYSNRPSRCTEVYQLLPSEEELCSMELFVLRTATLNAGVCIGNTPRCGWSFTTILCQ